jgi:hypothetical protein
MVQPRSGRRPCGIRIFEPLTPFWHLKTKEKEPFTQPARNAIRAGPHTTNDCGFGANDGLPRGRIAARLCHARGSDLSHSVLD